MSQSWEAARYWLHCIILGVFTTKKKKHSKGHPSEQTIKFDWVGVLRKLTQYFMQLTNNLHHVFISRIKMNKNNKLYTAYRRLVFIRSNSHCVEGKLHAHHIHMIFIWVPTATYMYGKNFLCQSYSTFQSELM